MPYSFTCTAGTEVFLAGLPLEEAVALDDDDLELLAEVLPDLGFVAMGRIPVYTR
jgi:hypothetical protein